MAVPTLTDGRVLFNSADSGIPTQMGGQAPAKKASENAVHMQGSGCGGVSTKVGAENTNWASTSGGQLPGTSVNLTNKHFWVWSNCFYLLFTKASHGMAVGISSSANNKVSTFTFTGGDEYTGGWTLGCADASGTADTGTGYPSPATLTSVVGMGVVVNAQFAGETYLRSIFLDALRHTGTTGVTNGYSVSGGATGGGANAVSFDDIGAVDMAQANRYGICYYKDGSYLSTGEMEWGVAATNTYIEDDGQTFSFLDLPVNATGLYAITGISGTTSTTSIVVSNTTFAALGTTNFFTFDMSALTGANDVGTFSKIFFRRATLAKFSTKCTVTSSSFVDCTTVFPNGITFVSPIFNNCDAVTLTTASDLISGGTVSLHNTAVNIPFITTDDLEKITGTTFDNTGGTGHAIEITTAGTYAFVDNTFTGYGVDESSSAAIYNNSGGAVTINVSGGTEPTVRNGTLATTTVVVDPVTTLINVKDDDGVNLQNARVYMQASDGAGDLPFEESVTSITRSGTTATVTHTAHGLNSNEYVNIDGITDKVEDNYGAHQVTVTDANTYTYPTTNSGSTTYTGTIIATGAVLDGLTDVSGNISSSRTFASNQNVTGNIRKSGTSPRFKSFNLAGNTIDSANGLTINVRLVSDE